MLQENNVFSKFAQHTVWDFIISRGIIALIIGILFITMPEITINIIFILVGIFLLLNGLTALIKAMKLNSNKKLLLIYGLICLTAGLIILIKPEIMEKLFVIVFALLFFVSGGNQLVAAIKTKSTPSSARILAALTGILSLAVGLALLLRPDIGIRVIVMLIGIYFLAFGVLAIATGSVIRKAGKKVKPM
ncbi:MAG: DUF308 domain-containing protein [Victivallaceae bacterium]|nr:DUF308 domain-containing protein [Victivallaceae bacterium]